MLINDFYGNREIFITGGTGFLGKALIEKLLRDSPKIKVIYVLLRAKKSLKFEERLEQLKNEKAFDRIREECPQVLNKLYAIQGDCGQLGLGIQPNDLKLLQNVSIIFHMAANVKFDAPLRSLILLNTRGTYEMVKIAETLRNLVVFLHCSTAYCNPYESVVEERVYKMPVDWRTTIKIAENYDEDTVNTLCYKYTGHYPNNYTFTKNVSEQLINDYMKKLPLLIFRPSIVLSAYKEPVPGWIDNLNGPIAGMVALNVGIIPVFCCKGDLRLDAVPIDMVTKFTIVAAYKRGISFLRKESVHEGTEVINCAAGDIYDVNMAVISTIFKDAGCRNPMENIVWHFDKPSITGCYYNFLFQMFLMSIPLAIVLDTMLCFIGRKPMMIAMSRRVVYAVKAVNFFSSRQFKMINKNLLSLEDSIPQSEIDTYGVKRDFDLDLTEYFENASSGAKHFLFDQPLQATAEARKRAKILFILSRSIRFFIITLFIYYLWLVVSKLG